MNTLKNVGINVTNQQSAVEILKLIFEKSKESGKSFDLVAKEFRKNYNKK